MRSARMVLATATATAALAIAAPAAYADHSGDGGYDKSSHSKEYDKESKDSKEHDKPHGGMHTGGGALAVVGEEDRGTAKDPEHDPETYEEKDDSGSESSSGKQDKEWNKEEKPRGGMHTGGGALAVVGEEDWGTAKDPKYDPETYKKKDDSGSESSSGKQDKEWNKEEKPRGGMHTGGGGLAEPGVTAGGMAALAVLGAGAYALRRKKAAGGVA